MRIEAGEHPLDRAFHKLLVFDLVDIARLDLFVDREKLFKLTELVGLAPASAARFERAARLQEC